MANVRLSTRKLQVKSELTASKVLSILAGRRDRLLLALSSAH